MDTLKFLALLFKFLPNEAHFNFFEKAVRAVENSGAAVQGALGTLVTQLKDWFAKETACIAWYRKSALTAVIADADHRLDHALVGLSALINAARYSVDAAVATAAEHLYIMLKSYGTVISKPYLQEIGAVRAILAHLKGDLAADAQLVGATGWIAEIEGALAEFVTLFEEREAHTLEKPQQSFPEVRRGIEDVWHQIVTLVNSGAALNISPEFAALINLLNPEITYLNNEFHHAKQDVSTAQPALILPQPYTGEPVVPVPEVLLPTPKGTIKLTLGKDFNVTYKNNIEVGNAECTIRGKGKYKGHKTVTFIITR